jgi:hypothetical protein
MGFTMKEQFPILPPFVRYAWTEYRSQHIWKDRIQGITQAWKEIEIASVSEGLRSCALLRIPLQDMAGLEKRLSAQGLVGVQCPPVAPVVLQESREAEHWPMNVTIGSMKQTALFLDAWKKQDHKEIGSLLGYPDCCCDFYFTVCVKQKHVDTVWWAAVHTARELHNSNNPTAQTKDLCEIGGHPTANIILHKMNLNAVPHLPCSFHCKETIAKAHQFIQLGKEAGYTDEMNWLLEILSWPMEWSALHGIAEIKTPVFKMITNTDATPTKQVVRWMSNLLLKEGAPQNLGSGLRCA